MRKSGFNSKRFKNLFFICSIIIVSIIISACGNGVVDIGSQNYQQKIVIEGYLFPESPPKNIKICRNFPLNTIIDSNSIFIKDASAQIIDISSGKGYRLEYNQIKETYEYTGNDFKIDYGKSYKLIVYASIDGKALNTSSTTTTPLMGLQIDRSKSVMNNIRYRQKDEYGNLVYNIVVFNSSPGTDFYVIDIIALDANPFNLIYENPLLSDTTDLYKRMSSISNRYSWLQNVQSGVNQFEQRIDWLNTWFYGRYQVIVYAGDQNFKDYLLTHGSVMEMDGNLHEPRFYFDGDGIGVFGSAIADTVYFNLLK